MVTVEASLLADRSGWKTWRFHEIAENVTDRVDDPSSAGVERYVGLEHLDPDSVAIRRWGRPSDVSATKLFFRKGDIIFGRRRAYQRKLGVASFDGICSAHALVLRAREDVVLPEFLPFFLQSENFFSRALEISVGSLSPTINWRTLAKQEFALPPKPTQYRICNLLTSLNDQVEVWRKTLSNLARVHDSRRAQVFGSRPEDHQPLGELYDVQLGKMLSKAAREGPDQYPYLGNHNVRWGFVRLKGLAKMSFSDGERKKFELRAGDVLVCEGGEVGRAAVWRGELDDCFYQKAVHRLRAKDPDMDPEFIVEYLEHAARRNLLARLTGQSTIAHLPAVKLRELPVPVLDQQDHLELVRLSKSFREVRQTLESHLGSTQALLAQLRERLVAGVERLV